jgi:prevent-host-death family protein
MRVMLGVAETKRRFGEVIDRVLAGERVVVTRRGKPVAAIVPLWDHRKIAPVWDDRQIDSAEPAPEADDRPLGLGALAGAMSGWQDLEEVMAAAVTTRSVARERDVPGLE